MYARCWKCRLTRVGVAAADGIPIVIRACVRGGFEQGPFKLGRLQLPINLLAAAWVVISAVRSLLPSHSAAPGRRFVYQ